LCLVASIISCLILRNVSQEDGWVNGAIAKVIRINPITKTMTIWKALIKDRALATNINSLTDDTTDTGSNYNSIQISLL